MTTLINTTTRFAFYQISRQGRQVTMRFGRIGSRGNVRRATLRSRRLAKLFVDEKVTSKTGREYVPLANNILPRQLANKPCVWLGQ